jgi:hypothetical protein
MSRPHLPTRVVTYPVQNRAGTTYKAEVKSPSGRVYVGTFDSEAEGQAAGLAYLATGVLPPRRKRGPKPGANARRPRKKPTGPKPPPAPTFPPARPDRIAMMRLVLARIS